jgi:hypothetical protein
MVGLDETAEGSDPKGFPQENLPKWILLLQGSNIEIQHAHQIYIGNNNRSRSRTLIFCLLRYED